MILFLHVPIAKFEAEEEISVPFGLSIFNKRKKTTFFISFHVDRDEIFAKKRIFFMIYGRLRKLRLL